MEQREKMKVSFASLKQGTFTQNTIETEIVQQNRVDKRIHIEESHTTEKKNEKEGTTEDRKKRIKIDIDSSTPSTCVLSPSIKSGTRTRSSLVNSSENSNGPEYNQPLTHKIAYTFANMLFKDSIELLVTSWLRYSDSDSTEGVAGMTESMFRPIYFSELRLTIDSSHVSFFPHSNSTRIAIALLPDRLQKIVEFMKKTRSDFFDNVTTSPDSSAVLYSGFRFNELCEKIFQYNRMLVMGGMILRMIFIGHDDSMKDMVAILKLVMIKFLAEDSKKLPDAFETVSKATLTTEQRHIIKRYRWLEMIYTFVRLPVWDKFIEHVKYRLEENSKYNFIVHSFQQMFTSVSTQLKLTG